VSYILEEHDSEELNSTDPRQNALLLIAAGTETTSAYLSGFLYCILKNPTPLSELTREIRLSFKSAGDITLTSPEKLPYLKACMSELFRFYPPVIGALPRIVPPRGASISGRYVPEKTTVGVCHWAV